MKRKLILIFAILVLWQMASGMIQKEVILPYPGDVLQQMVAHLFQQSFYIAAISTLGSPNCSIPIFSSFSFKSG